MKTPQEIIELLSPFINDKRKAKIDAVLAHRLNSIQLAMESPSDINNALAAIRTAEAFGIDTVHIIHPEGPAVHARTVTQGACYWVNILFYNSLAAFLAHAKNQKLLLAGAKMDGEYTLSNVPIENPICILLGNERRGLSPEALAAINLSYRIPMCGMSESLNLSVSAAISLYDLTQRKRAALSAASDLSEAQQCDHLAKAYQQSVSKKLISHLLK